MERKKFLEADTELLDLYKNLLRLYNKLDEGFNKELQRHLPFNELLIDRWDKAKNVHAGEGTNIYDSSIIMGDVAIGKECWIGPNTILDGSGGCLLYTSPSPRD